MVSTAVLDPTELRAPAPAGEDASPRVEALLPPRQRPRLLVVVDGSAGSTRQLMWALREAARREATVLAVAVVDSGAGEEDRAATHVLLEAQVLHAIGETGVHGRSRTALVDSLVLEAFTGAARGADLVVVRPHSKAVLRPAVPRPPRRPLIRC